MSSQWPFILAFCKRQGKICIIYTFMLKLTVAMLKPLMKLFISIAIGIPAFLVNTPGLYVSYPPAGAVVQGVVKVIGSLPEEKFRSGVLSYAFDDGSNPNWFVITKFDKPLQDEVLGIWDSTTITDGNYQLRLKVNLIDGTNAFILVKGIQVANYTRIFSTPIPEAAVVITTEEIDLTSEIKVATPTALKINPAAIHSRDLLESLGIGLFIGIFSLLILAIYIFLRNRTRN
jgi:hypothetical protein